MPTTIRVSRGNYEYTVESNGDTSTWSSFPATQTVDMGCFGLENVLSIGGCTATNILLQGVSGWEYKVATGNSHIFKVNNTEKLFIDGTEIGISNARLNLNTHEIKGVTYLE